MIKNDDQILNETNSSERSKTGFYDSPRKALEEVGGYYKGWSAKLTEASLQMCYALIGANWVVFGTVGHILESNFAKLSLLMVMLTLGINVIGAWILSESMRMRFDWAEGHCTEWQQQFDNAAGQRDPFPFTRFHESVGFWMRQIKAIFPLIGAILLIVGAIQK